MILCNKLAKSEGFCGREVVFCAFLGGKSRLTATIAHNALKTLRFIAVVLRFQNGIEKSTFHNNYSAFCSGARFRAAVAALFRAVFRCVGELLRNLARAWCR